MVKLKKVIQIVLLGIITQASLLLVVKPTTSRFSLTVVSCFTIVGILLLLVLYILYVSKGLEDVKYSMRRSKSFSYFLLLYFLMILVNALGVVFLCENQVIEQTGLKQMFFNSFLTSSLLLLGMDMIVFSRYSSPSLVHKKVLSREHLGIFLGFSYFSFLKNPREFFCFFLYLSLGFLFVYLMKHRIHSLELSLSAHIIRNILTLLLLPFCM